MGVSPCQPSPRITECSRLLLGTPTGPSMIGETLLVRMRETIGGEGVS